MEELKTNCCFYIEHEDMSAHIPMCLRYNNIGDYGVCPCQNCEIELTKSEALDIIRKYVNGELIEK